LNTHYLLLIREEDSDNDVLIVTQSDDVHDAGVHVASKRRRISQERWRSVQTGNDAGKVSSKTIRGEGGKNDPNA